jgi:hypothetical protein
LFDQQRKVKTRAVVLGRAVGAKSAAYLFEAHRPECSNQVTRRFVLGYLTCAQHLVLVGQQPSEQRLPSRIDRLAEFYQTVAAAAPLRQERIDQYTREGMRQEIQRQMPFDQFQHLAVMLVFHQKLTQQKLGA